MRGDNNQSAGKEEKKGNKGENGKELIGKKRN